MPKSKRHFEVLDDEATDDDVIFVPKPSTHSKHPKHPKQARAGKRGAGRRSSASARNRDGAGSKSLSVSSPVAHKPRRRRTQGVVKTPVEEKHNANRSEQPADRQSPENVAAPMSRKSAPETTAQTGVADTRSLSFARLKPSKTIAKRSSKSSSIVSVGSKSKPCTKPENQSTSQRAKVPPSTTPPTKRLKRNSSKPRRKSARKTRGKTSDTQLPSPEVKRKRKYQIRKRVEEQPQPAEEVEEYRSYFPSMTLPEKEEANYPHSDISSDVDLTIENTSCTVCSELGDYANMVLCDACASGCHVYCMQPSRTSIPLGTWLCPPCHTVAKRHRIYLSRMVVLREEQRCNDCVKRNVKNYNFKSPVQTCSDCRLVFHTHCLRRFHNMKNAHIQKKDWTCDVCVVAEEKRKEEEAAMLAKQRARIAEKRAKAKHLRLSAPYLGGAIASAPSHQASYRNSKPATFVATSLPPVPIGNHPHFQSSGIVTDSPTPQANEGRQTTAEQGADHGEPNRDISHSVPLAQVGVSISTYDRAKSNTQRAYGTSQDPGGLARPSPVHADELGGNSHSRTTSIPLMNSTDVHTISVRREANPMRAFSNQTNSMPTAPQVNIPLEREVVDEVADTQEMRRKMREWNENGQNSVNGMFRYKGQSPNRRTPIVTSSKSKTKSKPVTAAEAIPPMLYSSNVAGGGEQGQIFTSILPTTSQRGDTVQNNFFPHTYSYGRWKGQVPPETDLRQDPRSYQPGDSARFVPPQQPSPHVPPSSRALLPEAQIRSRLSPSGPTRGQDGNMRPPAGSSVPVRNHESEMTAYQSRNQIPPNLPFDPSSAMPSYPSAIKANEVTASVRFQNEAVRDIPRQKGNAPTHAAAAPALSERNAIRSHGVVRSPEIERYAMKPNGSGHRAASEPHRQQTIGSLQANVQMNDHMASRFGLNVQERSESCGPNHLTRMLVPDRPAGPVSQSQSSGQAALMRAALTQAANHVGYSQSHAQNGNAVVVTKDCHGTGMTAEQITSSKEFPSERLGSTGEPRPQERANNANGHTSNGGAKSTVSIADKGTGATMNSAPLSPAPLQKSTRQSNSLEKPSSSKGELLGSNAVVRTQEEPEFVESGSLRAWIMLNISPRQRFHGSMFLDMPYRSYFSGAVRVLYDESRRLRVVAFSKLTVTHRTTD
ncbi:Zinc finger RING/FYVE/PHD-type [Gracilaria domingensis]|nr:Zinc finger RING/FYVE/PHD-type [Gracilaria domingensis]